MKNYSIPDSCNHGRKSKIKRATNRAMRRKEREIMKK